jgi:hypothetical protein
MVVNKDAFLLCREIVSGKNLVINLENAKMVLYLSTITTYE